MKRKEGVSVRATFNGMGAAACSIGILLCVLAAGCGGGGEEKAEPSAQAGSDEQAATVVDVATAATVTGQVNFKGTPPTMAVIDLSSEPTCHEKAHDPVHAQTVIVNDNGTLKNSFVYVKQGLENANFPPPSEPVVLDQVGCRYHPHVFGIQAKQPLKIKNSDEGVLHNIHAFSKKGNVFNFGMPKVMESVREFKRSEVMVDIKCDVHSWMNSYAGVLDHPYYAVTGDDGTFNLAPLPPGEYVIEAWHEEYGTQTQTITVTEKETKEISFTFEPAS